MRNKVKKRIRSNRGFSLAETFLAILIMLLVSAVVVAGIPSAANAYYKVVEAANAQVLLSTTMTVLRNELGTASDVETDAAHDNYIFCTTGGSGRICIYFDENEDIGIKKQASIKSSEGNTPGGNSVPLVSKATANKSLHTEYVSVTYDSGVVTFTDLSVVKDNGGTTLAKMDTFQIRVLSDTQ